MYMYVLTPEWLSKVGWGTWKGPLIVRFPKDERRCLWMKGQGTKRPFLTGLDPSHMTFVKSPTLAKNWRNQPLILVYMAAILTQGGCLKYSGLPRTFPSFWLRHSYSGERWFRPCPAVKSSKFWFWCREKEIHIWVLCGSSRLSLDQQAVLAFAPNAKWSTKLSCNPWQSPMENVPKGANDQFTEGILWQLKARHLCSHT